MSELSGSGLDGGFGATQELGDGAEFESPDVDSSAHRPDNKVKNDLQFNIPGRDAEPATREAFWSELGRPSSPDGYAFSPGEDATGYDTELAQWFRATAHDLNMPVDMAEALHDRFLESRLRTVAERLQSRRERGAEAMTTLSREWGASYNSNLQLAQRAVADLGGEELRETLETSGLGDDPSLIRAFAAFGRRLYAFSENNDIRSSDEQPEADPKWRRPSAATQAQREILRLRSDDKFMAAYSDRTHPSHEIAQTQMDDLYSVAYPPLIP